MTETIPCQYCHTTPPCRHVPVSDPSETLALIAEYRLTVGPADGGRFHETGWAADPQPGGTHTLGADGPTIGDAVRACVARIKA